MTRTHDRQLEFHREELARMEREAKVLQASIESRKRVIAALEKASK